MKDYSKMTLEELYRESDRLKSLTLSRDELAKARQAIERALTQIFSNEPTLTER